MSFNDGAQLDPSQAEDRRGGMGTGKKVGIGLGGGLVLLIGALLGINPSLLEGLTGAGTGQEPAATGTQGIAACKTGAQANERLDCRIVGTANSLNDFWPAYLKPYGVDYTVPTTVIFSNGTNTACGPATTDVGPFYCPGDGKAYFDPAFFQELETRFGSSGGPLAQEYVVAHEFGHHIQDLLGTIGRAQQDPQGAASASVRTELQADCYAGIWIRYASSQPDPATGQPFLEKITQKDLNDALSAASSVGDDRIQQAATGSTNPETWTHGSSAQRQKWLYTGYQTADLQSCDTFAVKTP
ncbi:KPN_02809 family neutral zinc metallopeptidase [Arthrobacter sp. 35W]|uniref:KPN_02809 family neutral zinc metallopeptidase n=1 Tax=Arthrobacter sp. 35W TaxID=1132441 RepID=UPI00047CACAA|nr:neutral zinc metallopeptidase [Arthrobacter sp. 35W]